MKQPIGPRYCAVIAVKSAASPRLSAGLTGAGWTLRSPADPQSLQRDVSLVVHDVGDPAWSAPLGDVLRITVGDAGPAAPGDQAISGLETEEALTALFALWLPPAHDQLERMAKAFGRDSLTPLVVSLRDELRIAASALAQGWPCDAHKLSGLTGTIGFAAASAAWRREEEAGDAAVDAHRTTRTAIAAINRWLAD